MHKAFLLAEQAAIDGEVPVGAVIVDEHHQLIGSGSNAMISQNDPTAHAEILAIREAARSRENYRLNDCTIYVTLEPCPMCASALVHARIKRLVFAVRDFKTGAAGSLCNLVNHPKLNHNIQVDEGLMMVECRDLLQVFFQGKR